MTLDEAIAELTKEVNEMVKRAEAEKAKKRGVTEVSWIQLDKTIIRADQIVALVEDRFDPESVVRRSYGEKTEQKDKGYDYVEVYLKGGGRVTVYDITAEEIASTISHITDTL